VKNKIYLFGGFVKNWSYNEQLLRILKLMLDKNYMYKSKTITTGYYIEATK
jgi:hypothetical protein